MSVLGDGSVAVLLKWPLDDVEHADDRGEPSVEMDTAPTQPAALDA
jgi:hypothetical protein